MFKIYLLPAIIFQITIIAGGYGTGQEFVQFFLPHGAQEGLYGLAVSGICWSIVCMISFYYAVQWQSYDYKAFFKRLLGTKWYLFELTYLLLSFIVLAVVAASMGNLGEIMFGTSYNFNITVMVLSICLCVYLGSRFIEHTFSVTSFVIIITYFLFCAYGLQALKPEIQQNLQTPMHGYQWIIAGIKYAGYNLGLIPAVFFALRYIKTTRQALIAGAIAGLWAILPAMLFYVVILGKYPHILQETIPSVYLLGFLNQPWLTTLFSLVLFITLAQTSISLVHSFTERLKNDFAQRNMSFPRHYNLAIGLGISLAAMVLAQFGLGILIKYGYGILTWFIITIYIAPLLLQSLVLRRL